MKSEHHDYYLVDPSPWPLVGSLAAFTFFLGFALSLGGIAFGKILAAAGFLMILTIMFVWWRDVIREGYREKAFTGVVQKGLRLGMALFIVSELMFFFAFFWSFFKASLLPVDILGDIWPIKEGIWPPEGVQTFDPWDLPFINTLILLLSGTTVTWAHHSLLQGNQKDTVRGLLYTVILGVLFTTLQVIEYSHAPFGFKDGIYSSNFYMATGFHGFHVMIGTIFLAICYLRAVKGDLSEKHHLGFEFAAWYWHFVDVVWLFLFAFVYWWGGA